jgi:hypothetical protein
MEKIIDLATKFRSIYEVKCAELDIPFFNSFPKNCCEGASFFFGLIVQDMYPNQTVEIIKARRVNECEDEYHYWIEIEEHIFDLTCDQFDSIHLPILGIKLNDHLGFQEVEREFITYYLLFYSENCLEMERLNPVKTILIGELAQHA